MLTCDYAFPEMIQNELPPYEERPFTVGDDVSAMQPHFTSTTEIHRDNSETPICQKNINNINNNINGIGAIATRSTATPEMPTSSADLSALLSELEACVAPLIHSIATSNEPNRRTIRTVSEYIPCAREKERDELRGTLRCLVSSALTSDQPESEDFMVAAAHIPHTTEDGQEKLRVSLADRVRSTLGKTELSLSSLENAIDLIHYASKEDQNELMACAVSQVCPVLKKVEYNTATLESVIDLTPYMNEEDRSKFGTLVAQQIYSILRETKPSISILKQAIRLIPYASEKDQDEFRALVAHGIHSVLEKFECDILAMRSIVDLTPYMSEEDQNKFGSLVVSSTRSILKETEHNTYAIQGVLDLIPYVSKNEQNDLRSLATLQVDSVLRNPTASVSAINNAINLIPATKQEDHEKLRDLITFRVRSTLEELKHDDVLRDILTIRSVVGMIPHAGAKDQEKLTSCAAGQIRSILEKPKLDSFLLKGIAELIPRLGKDQEGLRTLMERHIISVARSKVSQDTVELLWYMNEGARAKLIADIVQNDKLEPRIRKTVADQIQYIAEKSKAKELYSLFRRHITIKPEKDLTKSPLHDAARDVIAKFPKGGSETYILPNKKEASMRIITLKSAIAWLTAFRDWPAWREAGFNYIPIEPILGITPTDEPDTTIEPDVAVTTTNLRGRSYDDALPYFREFASELAAMKDAITSTLCDLGVDHGHLHGGNFVVVPFVKEDGEVDFSRCPRLYVIDFDQAQLQAEDSRAQPFQNAA